MFDVGGQLAARKHGQEPRNTTAGRRDTEHRRGRVGRHDRADIDRNRATCAEHPVGAALCGIACVENTLRRQRNEAGGFGRSARAGRSTVGSTGLRVRQSASADRRLCIESVLDERCQSDCARQD